MKRYTTEQPRFASVCDDRRRALESCAAMRLTMPWFQTFP